MDSEKGAKQRAGFYAVDRFVADDSCIGLGTGSTAYFAIERVGARIREGLRVRAVPTSRETAEHCRALEIPLVELGTEPVEVAIDGADEVAPDGALIKGGGGALFREKAVALAAKRFIVIVTERKLVERLGAFPLPLEVVPFSVRMVAHEVEALGARVEVRKNGTEPFVSDNGNFILDAHFGTIERPAELERELRALHGLVCTGLFLGLTSKVIVARENGALDER